MPIGKYIERDPTAALAILEKRIAKLEDSMADVLRRLAKLEKNNDVTTVNNITFKWDGASSKIYWAAGYVKDRAGAVYFIPANRTTLSPSTTYWAGWNFVQQTMSFVTDLEVLHSNVNTLVICSFKTGTVAQSGTAGGGGSDTGGTNYGGRPYNNFP